MLRTRRFKPVVNPESVNELYDLEEDPSELTNRYGDPALGEVRSALQAASTSGFGPPATISTTG
ncbi:hypothetical protein ACGFJC_53160 [Nonomuraea fuscirosea]|uniref:hypothetical protein n=1 Tax=Nonomuraea fuscirosea TaxID=1291556 RepID=UPI003483949D